LFVPLLGLTDKTIEWWNLLGEREIWLIAERHAQTEGNTDALKNEIADSILQEAGYPTGDDEAESRAKALRQLLADHAQLRARINAIPDDVKSAILESDNARALAEEAEEIFRSAGKQFKSKYRPAYESQAQQIYRFPNGRGASIVKIEEGPRKGQVAFATLRFSEPNNPTSTWYIDHLHTKRGDLDIDEKTVESRLDEIANMKEGDD